MTKDNIEQIWKSMATHGLVEPVGDKFRITEYGKDVAEILSAIILKAMMNEEAPKDGQLKN